MPKSACSHRTCGWVQAGDPKTFNRYAYVSANPLKFVDSSGHAQVCDDGGSACAGPRKVVTPSVQRYRAWSYAWAEASQAATRAASRPRSPTVYSPTRSLRFGATPTPASTRRSVIALAPTIQPAYRAASTPTSTPRPCIGEYNGPTMTTPASISLVAQTFPDPLARGVG